MSKFQVGDKVMWEVDLSIFTVVVSEPDASAAIVIQNDAGRYLCLQEKYLALVPDTVMVKVEMTRDEVGEAVEHLKILGERHYPWFGHFVEACRKVLEEEA